jgi:biotin carboxyl carrier protein
VRYFVKVGEESLELQVDATADGTYRVQSPDGSWLPVSALAKHGSVQLLSIAGRVLSVQLSEGEVKLGQQRFSVQAESERTRGAARARASEAKGATRITAPMPGRIVRVSCAPGDAVSKGAALVVIEAMKMQNELCAKADGIVSAVHVASGATVDRGAVLIELA